MKNSSLLLKENWENLTSLWKTASIPSQSFFDHPDYSYCLVQDSEWPNRLWFHQDISRSSLVEAREKLKMLSAKMIIPYADVYESGSWQLLEENGFRKLFEQLAMCRKLDQSFSEDGTLEVKVVSDGAEAALWSQLFFKSFGYLINPALLPRSCKNTSFLLAYYQQKAAGTGIIHRTGDIAGIHGIGIIPEMRRKGLAEQLMKHILKRETDRGLEYATLQASDMGKGLYLKLGFEEQFRIKNYVLHAMI